MLSKGIDNTEISELTAKDELIKDVECYRYMLQNAPV